MESPTYLERDDAFNLADSVHVTDFVYKQVERIELYRKAVCDCVVVDVEGGSSKDIFRARAVVDVIENGPGQQIFQFMDANSLNENTQQGDEYTDAAA